MTVVGLEELLGRIRLQSERAQDWWDEAECAHQAHAGDVDVEVFYPERGERADRALAACDRCPVWWECLRYALDEDFGVWGRCRVSDRRAARKAIREGQLEFSRDAVTVFIAERRQAEPVDVGLTDDEMAEVELLIERGEVAEVVALALVGETEAEIAEAFGITRSVVHVVVRAARQHADQQLRHAS